MRHLCILLLALSLTIAKPITDGQPVTLSEATLNSADSTAETDQLPTNFGGENQLNQAQTIGYQPTIDDVNGEIVGPKTDTMAEKTCIQNDGVSKRDSAAPSNACPAKRPHHVPKGTRPSQQANPRRGPQIHRQNPKYNPQNPEAGDLPIPLWSGRGWCPSGHPHLLCSGDIPYVRNPDGVESSADVIMWRPEITNCRFCT